MQLRIARSQRDTGMINKTVAFAITARAVFTAQEQANIQKYRLGSQVIYSSAAAQKQAEKGAAQMDGSTLGSVKAIGSFLAARLNLNITIESLSAGQHIECKSLEEVLAAEEAIDQACQNLMMYLSAAATFDGRETVREYSANAAA